MIYTLALHRKGYKIYYDIRVIKNYKLIQLLQNYGQNFISELVLI